MGDAIIWVFVETEEGKPSSLSLQMLSKARELGTAEAVVLSPEADGVATALGEYGASRVYVGQDPAYAEYLVLPAVDTLSTLIEAHRPRVVLFGTTYYSRDVAARLAARLRVGAITDAVELALQGDTIEATVAALGGSYRVKSTLANAGTKIVLVRPKAFDAVAVGGTAEIEAVTLPIREEARMARVVEQVVQAESGPGLEDATFVVSGGRGMKGAEQFEMLRELARLFDGAVGASRVAVDMGWVPYSYQVGQTGKTVKPSVYLAFGISGAFQHITGMSGSKTIVAVNKDPEAQIFKVADFGVVGDLFQVLPQLIGEVKRRRGNGV